MQDVAELAGVSRTTVSFVLNSKQEANIPQVTQDRVWSAVKALGYRPNAIARNLRAQSTNTIGFVSDVIATTPFAVRILQGAQDTAWQSSKLLLMVNTGGDKAIRDAGIRMLLERQVDGIIYATMYHREVKPPDMIREVPTVLLDCYVGDRSLPSVVPDEVRGGFEATTYLLQKGHTRIALISDQEPVPAQIGRKQGYRQALEAAHIPFDPALVGYCSSTPAGGREAALKLLTRPERPTAIFCFNDRVAMGVYDAVRELKLTIPNDVAVVGFDDQILIAADIRPGLTTMALPHYEMGRWAVDHLLELIVAQRDQTDYVNSGEPVQKSLHCPLIERMSA